MFSSASIPVSIPASEIPTTLSGQFVRQAPRYGIGLVLLGTYQYFQYWFDTRLSKAIDAATRGDTTTAGRIGAALVGVAVGSLVIRVSSRIAVFNAGRIAEYELRRALLHQLQRLGPSFYRRISTGDIMSRSTNDLTQVRLLLGFGVLNSINTLFALVSALAVTLHISVKLTMASLSTLPLLLIAMWAFARVMFARQRQNQEAIGDMSGAVQSSIAGVRVVRSFSLEQDELRRFDRTNADYLDKTLGLARLRGLMFPVMQAITAIGTIIVLWYGGSLMLHQEMSAGNFLAFFRALSRLTWPLISLGFLISMLQRGRAAFTRLEDVFGAEPDIVSGHLPPPEVVRGQLSVRGLSFSYGNHQVLEDVRFEVEPGMLVAIVGKTGSGKSTLAALLPRLQPTPRGTVFLDGADVCDLPLRTVRNAIGYAQQVAFLFSTTVGRNIGFCVNEPDSAEATLAVQAAARDAQIEGELAALPDGYDTVVGERGVQLSGGQKQLVALARALLAEPRVLVLDDPLSAVDARTERAILDVIEKQRARRSVVLVTHRVAAAARCDKVFVLDRGHIVEQGTHEELIARGGVYASFAEEQRVESELEALGGGPVAVAEAQPA
ncbi:MAG TPA: ABC transporter ATP-binding protein [Polyangiaceae bacterium]|nr:ABC transporter ATP-binding protein [Polyangiaceae bacterium]